MPAVEKIIINSIPIWEPTVWEALQKKDYSLTQSNLQRILTNFKPEDWEDIEWILIIEGAPAFRGNLTSEEWEKSAKPVIMKAVIDSLNEEAMKAVYESLPATELEFLQKQFSKAIPGGTAEEKINWLKSNRYSLYKFFISKPGFILTIPEQTEAPSPPKLSPLAGQAPQAFKVPSIGPIPTHDDEPKKVHYSNMKTELKS